MLSEMPVAQSCQPWSLASTDSKMGLVRTQDKSWSQDLHQHRDHRMVFPPGPPDGIHTETTGRFLPPNSKSGKWSMPLEVKKKKKKKNEPGHCSLGREKGKKLKVQIYGLSPLMAGGQI